MSFFERFLSLWVLLAMGAGILLAETAPEMVATLREMEWAHVNLPVAVLIWAMIIPMLLKVDLAALRNVRRHWRGMSVTLFVNWMVKPFSMAFLASVFLGWLFRDYLPADQIPSYVAGLILLAAAPCTAMVFVWSHLCDGDPHFTLSQVALNDTIMIVAFAPIVALLLGVSAITVPWETLLLSVGLYILVPVIFAQIWRHRLLAGGDSGRLARVLVALKPVSVGALLVTLVLLFAFQGRQVLAQPVIILLLAVPIVIQVYFNSALAYLLNRVLGERHCVAGPAALIGASNFFELAVATAISLFGVDSGAALATVVGVLVEVPVMLSVVFVVNRSRSWYERHPRVRACEEGGEGNRPGQPAICAEGND
ncbi:MAG: arsenical-resistance protein [Alphaproteobacteria bacterium]|nr:MAG: arsenical-resistance protein [Alphaproteobacteria bacterium]